MRILVTGCAGFIGSHVSARLLKDGYTVIGLDNLDAYYDVSLKKDRLKWLKHKDFVFHREDVAHEEAVDRLFARFRPAAVIHLAAQAGVRYSLERPQAYIRANVAGFVNVLEACRRYGAEHLVYASTSSVYGLNGKLPFSASDAAVHPVSVYAASKRADELLAHAYSHLYGLPSTGLRFFTVYGPWGRPDMALFLFTRQMLAGEPVRIFNNGRMKRDFTYIDDIVEGIVRILHKPPAANPGWDPLRPDASSSSAPFKVYNIGNHRPVGLVEFVEAIEKKLGVRAIKQFEPMQPGDVPETCADVSEFIAATGFQPNTPLEVGVGRFVDWFRSYYKI